MLYVLPFGSILFAMLVIGIDRLLLDAPDITVALGGKLSSTQLKSIDLLTELTKLVIASAIGLLGFVVYYIKSASTDLFEDSVGQLLSMIFSTWLSLGSIYFGHRVISLVVEMLANDYFSIISDAVARAVALQYILLCAAVVFVIFFVLLRHVPKIISNEKEPPKKTD